MTDSTVDPATIEAYRETEYRVSGEDGFVLRVGERSSPLMDVYQRCGVHCGAYLTACNPGSVMLAPKVNRQRQAALMKDLQQLGYPVMPGIGLHPSNGWPAEPSALVLGIPLEDARALGACHGQNAILWMGADAVPELVMLR